MSFENLMTELQSAVAVDDTMSKALPAADGKDEANIQAAAQEGGALDEEAEAKRKLAEAEAGEGGEPMGKSLGEVTLPNGDKVEAIDGTELVKSLTDQVGKLGAKQTESETNLVKALGTCVTLIKSLQTQVSKLSGEGRGRKTVLTVTERPAAGTQLQKSESEGMTGGEFMAKSHAAFEAKKISGLDLTTIDVSLRQGVAIDPALIAKVVSS